MGHQQSLRANEVQTLTTLWQNDAPITVVCRDGSVFTGPINWFDMTKIAIESEGRVHVFDKIEQLDSWSYAEQSIAA